MGQGIQASVCAFCWLNLFAMAPVEVVERAEDAKPSDADATHQVLTIVPKDYAWWKILSSCLFAAVDGKVIVWLLGS